MKVAVTSDSSAEDYAWDACAGLEFSMVNNYIPLAWQRPGTPTVCQSESWGTPIQRNLVVSSCMWFKGQILFL